MLDYLTDHARQNVWCTPDQDKQVIMKPARLTSDMGAWGSVTVGWGRYSLPNSERFHVYQIGQQHPILFGIRIEKNKWHNVADVCRDNKVLVDLYLNNGKRYPRLTSWMMFTKNQNLIMAVQIQPKIDPLTNEALYMRLYANAYFSSAESDINPERIQIGGGKISLTTDTTRYQTEVLNLRKLVGAVDVCVNGVYVDTSSPLNTAIGDVVEYCYDSTIKKIIELKAIDLHVFDSTLDTVRKYLLHYPADNGDENIIDYQDDIDIWLVQPGSKGRVGRFYHHNREASLRMVTHRDYAIPVNYVIGYLSSNDSFGVLDDLTIRLVIRHSGYARPLVFENGRIHELYKLPDQQVVGAMVGIDATVPFWTAAALEASPYTRLMRAKYKDINHDLVASAYGYNASTYITANSPITSTANGANRLLLLPYGCRENATVTEYDADGVLLGWGIHTYGDTWICKSPQCSLADISPGVGGWTLDRQEGGVQHTYNSNYTYRHYVCGHVNGVPDRQWLEVTGSDKYVITGNLVLWNLDPAEFFTLTLSDSKYLQYEIDVTPTDSLIQFSLNERRGGVQKILDMPLGTLDIWFNNRYLIRGLDYVVNFPVVTVFNKEYRVEGKNHLMIRASGFSADLVDFNKSADYGFVQYGVLSKNTTFDLRDDRVCRVAVGGGIKRRTDLKFAENTSDIGISTLYNGRPYIVEDVYVPLRTLLGVDINALKADSVNRDELVKQYMSIKLPNPTPSTPSPIPERYVLVSTVCSKLIADIKSGVFQGDYRGRYTDVDLREWFVPYQGLLPRDPVNMNIDKNYVAIHPHEHRYVVELDIYQYLLVERVIALFLGGGVDLTSFVAIV